MEVCYEGSIFTSLKNASKSATDGKQQYDRKERFAKLQPGDRVLVRNLSERGGPGKLRWYWEQQIHVVVEQRGDLPIYKVNPEGQPGKLRVLHRNLLLPCDFLAPETQESVPQSIREGRMRAHTRAHNGRDCQPNHNESDSEDGEEEEDLPGLLPGDLDRLLPPSLVTGQSGYTADEAMLESMGDGDGISSSTPESDKQPEVDPEPEQQAELVPEPEQQAELVPEAEQQPELVPEPEQQPDWEEHQAPSRPQRVRHPPKVFTYNTLGQPTICSSQTGSNLVPRWYYPPFQSPWMLPLPQYHPPLGYGPLVYSSYMQMMHPDSFTLLDFY